MLATLLLFFSFAVNFVGPRLAMRSMPLYGYGGGGGDAEVPELAMEAAPAEEMPSVASEPMTEEPAAPAEAPAPVATQMPEGTGEATTRVEPTLEVAAKNGEPEQAQADSEAMGEPLPVVPAEPIPVAWQIGLGILALANIVIVVIMRKSAVSKWQK